MRGLILGLVVLLISPVIVCAGEKENLIEEMLSMLKLQQTIEQYTEQQFQMLSHKIVSELTDKGDKESISDFMKQAQALLLKEMSGQKLKDDYIRLLADTYSETEIRDIMFFYRTPSGQSMLSKQPLLLQKSLSLAQVRMERFQHKMKRLTKDFLDEQDCNSSRCAALANAGKPPIPFVNAEEQKDYQAYSARIGCGEHDNDSLSKAYRARGVVFSNHSYLKEALADFEQAIKLRPDYATAYTDKAIVYEKMQDFQNAYKSFTTALELDPKDAHNYAARGTAFFYGGKYTEAQVDFEKAISLNKADMYRMLWLYLSIERQGRDAKEMLRRYSSDADKSKWPGSVVDFYLGDLAEPHFLTSLKGTPDLSQKEQQCEAYFFIAQKYLLKKDYAKAAEYFQKTVDTNIKQYLEYKYALVELKRLKADLIK